MRPPAALLSLALLSAAPAAAPQGPATEATPLEQLATRLAGMTAVTGYEQAMVDSLLSLLPAARRDRSGSAVLMLGSGEPRRLLACPLDEVGFVVGGVRADGFLTLRRVGRAPTPLFDKQLEGERVTVFGQRGARPGVVAVRSVHLTRGRNIVEQPFTVDDAYLDLGARDTGEVAALGVAVLAPVALTKRPHRYGESLLAAPIVGRRAACAALLDAARGAKGVRGTVVVAFVTEQNLTLRGIKTVGQTLGPFGETVLLDGAAGIPGQLGDSAFGLDASLGGTTRWLLPTRYTGTPVETVSLADVAALETKLSVWIGGGQ